MEWWHDITLFPVCQQENPKKAFPYNQNTICTEPGAAQNAAYKRKILFEFHRGSEKNLKFPIKKPAVRRASDCRPLIDRLRPRTALCGPLPYGARASDCGSPFRAVLVLGAAHP